MNKKLIFFSCIRIPAHPPTDPPCDPFPLPRYLPLYATFTFSHRLIRSLIGKEADQLYSYKRKLHQQLPITFLFRSSLFASFPLLLLSCSPRKWKDAIPFPSLSGSGLNERNGARVKQSCALARSWKERWSLSVIIARFN